jgi:threonine dehydrogenase-like Zn-dependent dehydrogenase
VRAIRFDGTAVTIDRAAPDPQPAPGEALVRTQLMGVSSTDLDVLDGRVHFAGVMGQEFVGTVERVHAGADAPTAPHPLTGRRVVASTSIACASCDLCKRGLGAHCRRRAVLGAIDRDGCFADRLCLPVRNLHPVPDALSDEQAVFAPLVASALHTRQVFKPEGRPYITVLGDGPLGLVTVQIMARLNASVRLVGKHADKLALCERWGVKHRLLTDVGLRADQDVVIDCTGSPAGLATALAMVRPRGKVVLKGPMTPATHPKAGPQLVDLGPLVTSEIELIGSRCGSIPDALTMLARAEVDVLPLITRRGRLADAPALLAAARAHGQLKVLIAA